MAQGTVAGIVVIELAGASDTAHETGFPINTFGGQCKRDFEKRVCELSVPGASCLTLLYWDTGQAPA